MLHRGQCGKACYGSYGAARRAIRWMQRYQRDRKQEGYLTAYPCKACKTLHVGHEPYEDE